MVINFQVQGLKKLERKLKAAQDMMRSLKPYWQQVGMYIQRQTIKERFEKEQSPSGEKWKPLSDMTIAIRRKKHPTGNMKILKDNGELRRSIHYEAGNNYVKVGSVLKYARIHQFGGSINVSNKQRRVLYRKGFRVGRTITIPARPFLGITDSEVKHIKSMFKSYIKRHITGGG